MSTFPDHPFERIEEWAAALLEQFRQVWADDVNPMPVDIGALTEVCLGIEVIVATDQADPEYRRGVPYAVPDASKIVLMSNLDYDEPAYNTALAHELGHVFIHTSAKTVSGQTFLPLDAEPVYGLVDSKRNRAERQAWQFAVCIMLPRLQFSAKFEERAILIGATPASDSFEQLVSDLAAKAIVTRDLVKRAINLYGLA